MDTNIHQGPEGVQGVKEMLMAFRRQSKEIDNQILRLENLETGLYSVKSPVLSSMPHSPSPSHDKWSGKLDKKEQLDRDIREMVDAQVQCARYIEDILNQVENPDERAVIRLFYLDGERWGIVNQIMYGNNPDFLEREESYYKRVSRLHGRALVHMAHIISENDGDMANNMN